MEVLDDACKNGAFNDGERFAANLVDESLVLHSADYDGNIDAGGIHKIYHPNMKYCVKMWYRPIMTEGIDGKIFVNS